MPELPEVETVVTTLRPLLTGRRVSSFAALWPRTVEPQAAVDIDQALRTRTVRNVLRRGKYVVLEFDDDHRLAIHLRMTGQLRFLGPGDAPPEPEREQYLRAYLEFDGARLSFYDVRKFGRIRLYAPESWRALDEALGVEPLSDGFTPETLFDILRSRKRQIKPLLLDQSVIAGLGNIYVDEALFVAGIHPLTQSNSLSRSDAARLRDAIVKVLTQAIHNRGTTLRDYRTGTGEMGNNQSHLHVYGSREGTPCPKCGTPLCRLVIGQRGTVFCPRCQPEPARDQPA